MENKSYWNADPSEGEKLIAFQQFQQFSRTLNNGSLRLIQ